MTEYKRTKSWEVNLQPLASLNSEASDNLFAFGFKCYSSWKLIINELLPFIDRSRQRGTWLS